MSILKCDIPSCQYDEYLNLEVDNTLYFHKSTAGKYCCVFHSEELQKQEKELFLDILEKYIMFRNKTFKVVFFKNIIFYNFSINTNILYEKIDFDNVTFECYPDFDYLKCNHFKIKECSFKKGGRFKRIQINTLEIRTKIVEHALVFEAGGYAKNGLIQKSDGYINEMIKYTNHVSGTGQVFFVGINFKIANFTNAILDQVVFQNCNLKKVKFLNSKVDNTEFRNCIFPTNKIRKSFSELEKSFFEKHGFFILLFMGLAALYLLINLNTIGILFIMPVLLFTLFNLIAVIGEYVFKRIYHIWSDDDHYCTYDEVLLYQKMNDYEINDKDLIKDTFSGLSDMYGNLQRNFEAQSDFQKGGDFFYSRRYTKLLSSRGKFKFIERAILVFHFSVNGFGEKFVRPLIWLIAIFTISFFIVKPTSSGDKNPGTKFYFEATQNTPLFLLEDFNSSTPLTIKHVNTKYSVDLNNTQRLYGQRQINKVYSMVIPSLNNSIENRIMYVLSRSTSFITPIDKNWYKPSNEEGYLFSTFLGIVSWFFFGAFFLALRNRIRRK